MKDTVQQWLGQEIHNSHPESPVNWAARRALECYERELEGIARETRALDDGQRLRHFLTILAQECMTPKELEEVVSRVQVALLPTQKKHPGISTFVDFLYDSLIQ